MDASTYLRSAIADWFRGVTFPSSPADIYASLHEGNGTEIAVTRAVVSLADDVNGLSFTDADLVFASWPAGKVATHVRLWDASTSGNELMRKQLPSPIIAATGATVTIAAGDFSLKAA